LPSYETLREENRKEVKFAKQLQDTSPVDIYSDTRLSSKDHEMASKLLADEEYIDLRETNQKRDVQDTEIEKLDDLLNSIQ
jgi:hypothetical protein